MIKSILFIALFSGIINASNVKKSVNRQSICDAKYDRVNDKDPLKNFIQSLAKAPLINIPYGNKSVLKKFSTKWNLPDNKNTAQNKTIQNLNNDYNSLDSFFYADIENRNQIIVKANHITAQQIFTYNFVSNDDSLKINKKASVKVAALSLTNIFKTYSLIISGNKTCNNCEYPIKQIENVLINVDKKNNIIDKLIISSFVGSDLGSNGKFFYIDENKIIHIKEFVNDELTAGFKKYKQYKVMADGHFVENIKK
jgi:hypothetical protein